MFNFSPVCLVTIAVVFLALAFDFINGFHDTANAIANSVSTRVLSPQKAIIMAAFFNFFGAFMSTEVAKTIGGGMVNHDAISQTMVFAALMSAIGWNLITWYYGIPSSSSHALIGGLIGSAIGFKGSFAVIKWGTFLSKVVLWLFLSPVIGIVVGYLLMTIINWIFRKSKPSKVTRMFSKAQILSTAFIALNHGGNDGQKSMGIITMALLSGGFISQFQVPFWVKFSCAAAMAIGTSIGGWKIIKTLGSGITKLSPANGFAADMGAASVIFAATMFHAPVSTTHIISGSIMGVGASKRLSAVRWGVAKNILWTWVITIPVTSLIGYIIISILNLF